MAHGAWCMVRGCMLLSRAVCSVATRAADGGAPAWDTCMLQRTAEHVVTPSASPTASTTVSSMALSGKLALVTGASSGIGLAIAKMFVKEGESPLCAVRTHIIRTAQPR